MMNASHWPAAFVNRMEGWLGAEAVGAEAPAEAAGAEAVAFFAALAQRDVGLRLNSLRGSPAELQERIPWQTSPVPWCPAGLWLQEDAPVGKHPYHTAGVYYLQDPSAMAAAVLLDPRPGEWVLDLAAAPGGKATHLAARMGNRGVLVANEVARRRASVLAMNLERLGVTNALVSNETPKRLAERWPALFDAVLVDAPCSGESMFSRDPRALRDWSLATVAEYAHRQRTIMAQAAPLVRPGGRLLYGTCTFAPEENEGVVAAFLAEHPDFNVVDLPALPGLSPGRPEWIGAPDTLRRAGRFWPHHGPGHGHFYALLRRQGEPSGTLPERWAGTDVPGRVLQAYRRCLGETLTTPPPEEGLLLAARDELYVTPLAPRLWQGLRVLRPGWWVASWRHNKIIPDQALALTLRPEDAREVVTLAVDDPRLVKFLRGGFWFDEGPAGFVLVTVEGLPLGWAKRGEGRLRSRYPFHLRR